MSELYERLKNIFEQDIQKVTLSNPKGSEYRKVTLTRQEDGYFIEKFTQKQAFHETVGCMSGAQVCLQLMEEGLQQLHAWSKQTEYRVKITKKGTILYGKSAAVGAVKVNEPNRKKNYLIPEGTRVEALVDMGIFTKEGKVVQSMYDKYRQINKFLQFIDELVRKSPNKRWNIVDFGCGKSYLTFVVYYYLTTILEMEVSMVGLDLKKDVIAKCNATAKKYGYEHLHFQVGDISTYEKEEPVDLVITLHACDTATDYAMFHAIRWGAENVISVPCCQHELNGQLHSESLGIVERYGLIKERTAALYTDAIRANLLQACGYKTQVLEFVDFTHTPKNILIRAAKSNLTKQHKREVLSEVEELMRMFSLEPTLYTLLKEEKLL
ncbi:class I SAM-dependent methyltransferase [Eubacterium oxidoreducens]|uniref:Methyltransferase domain-containing protein n=1 Tax=Eubacterium oxidoreducens TaxID=1732 RepID=A0A1G6BCI4_EUBOX|nr:SAM-dependent methyltransferase [Eubacterium oxidoreducens]SDB18325.1 Methyltransferase domain-containing protein [Eubacterium oxidoreducens]